MMKNWKGRAQYVFLVFQVRHCLLAWYTQPSILPKGPFEIWLPLKKSKPLKQGQAIRERIGSQILPGNHICLLNIQEEYSSYLTQ